MQEGGVIIMKRETLNLMRENRRFETSDQTFIHKNKYEGRKGISLADSSRRMKMGLGKTIN
jgi:hypothetical protein